jgi:hypothetical protein
MIYLNYTVFLFELFRNSRYRARAAINGYNSSVTKRLYLFLTVFNLGWSVAAWVYDWPKLVATPVYIWPVMLVCPIYPLLLALTWQRLAAGRQPVPVIYALGILGSIVYGTAALIYYPYIIAIQGFDWWTFGAIFWVLAYGGQGLYFILRPAVKIPAWPWLVAAIYLAVKTGFDYQYQTFGYLINFEIDPNALIYLAVAVTAILVTWTIIGYRSTTIRPEDQVSSKRRFP